MNTDEPAEAARAAEAAIQADAAAAQAAEAARRADEAAVEAARVAATAEAEEAATLRAAAEAQQAGRRQAAQLAHQAREAAEAAARSEAEAQAERQRAQTAAAQRANVQAAAKKAAEQAAERQPPPAEPSPMQTRAAKGQRLVNESTDAFVRNRSDAVARDEAAAHAKAAHDEAAARAAHNEAATAAQAATPARPHTPPSASRRAFKGHLSRQKRNETHTDDSRTRHRLARAADLKAARRAAAAETVNIAGAVGGKNQPQPAEHQMQEHVGLPLSDDQFNFLQEARDDPQADRQLAKARAEHLNAAAATPQTGPGSNRWPSMGPQVKQSFHG
jgi:hypothetical protein